MTTNDVEAKVGQQYKAKPLENRQLIRYLRVHFAVRMVRMVPVSKAR